MGTLGGKIPFLVPKMTRNVDIMQITSQIGPFDNAKEQTKVHLGQRLLVLIKN
jgi:hypothetical protein